nr:MAG: phosphate butyryltransferase [Bacillota bacterium]
MKSFAEILAAARARGPKRVAVAAAADHAVLEAIALADREGLCQAVLFGDSEEIRRLAPAVGLDLSRHEVVHVTDKAEAAAQAVARVRAGGAEVLMKGMLDTATLLRAVLNRETGLRTGRRLTHTFVLEVPALGRLLLISDAAFNVAPDLAGKAAILSNAVSLAHALGIEEPKVAVLAAVEVVNPDMPATTDAAALKEMGARGEFGRCLVDGPLAMDLAVSPEAARHKGVGGPVAGHADILIVPDIEAGNILYKGLVYLAGAKVGGVVLGAAAPVVLVSRADSPESKLNAIALSLLV